MTQPCSAQPPTHTPCTNTFDTASHITTTYTGMTARIDPVEKKRRTDNAKFANATMAKSILPQYPMDPSRSSGSAGARGSADHPPQQAVDPDASIFNSIPPAMQQVGHDPLTKKYLEKHKDCARRPVMVARQASLVSLVSAGVGLSPGNNSCDQKGSGHMVDHGTYLFGTHTLEFAIPILNNPPPPPLQSSIT